MKLKVNGTDRELHEGSSIASLLDLMQLKPQNVAVEVNKRLVRGEKYDMPLKAGDEVEVVTFVGGG